MSEYHFGEEFAFEYVGSSEERQLFEDALRASDAQDGYDVVKGEVLFVSDEPLTELDIPTSIPRTDQY